MNDAPSPASGSRAIGGFAAAILAVCVIVGVVALELLLFPSLRIWNQPVNEFQEGVDAFRNSDLDGAIRHFSASIKRQPTSDIAYNWRGLVYRSKKDKVRALADFDSAIRLNPSSAGAHYNRGTVLHDQHDFAAALTSYDEALRLNSSFAMAYHSRANLRRAMGELAPAIADYTLAVRFDATNTYLLRNRAAAYQAQGDNARAIEDYESAIQLNSKEDNALNALAWLWSTCPQPKFRNASRAIEYAMRACELRQWNDAASVDTLAAAYAEAGDFKAAVLWQSKCLEMGTLAEADAAGARARLALYQAGKPYRLDK